MTRFALHFSLLGEQTGRVANVVRKGLIAAWGGGWRGAGPGDGAGDDL